MNETECPICKSQAAFDLKSGGGQDTVCPRCGDFSITGSASAIWGANNPDARQVANASGWIREHQRVLINSDDIEALLSVPSPSVAERAIKILTTLEKIMPSISEWQNIYVVNPANIGITYEKEPQVINGQLFWIGISYSTSPEELRYLLAEYLNSESNFLAISDQSNHLKVQITPKGYAYLAELRKTQVNSQIGFCAMWFDKSVLPIWTNAIEPAIKDAGYDAKRIDGHQHNNRIDDEIIAMLRRSKFVVADFTGQRGGVYFESGFALGLGLQVIWTCKKSDLKDVHFDNRQYNFVVWEEDKLGDFKAALQNRIEATIGRGNLN
jgi:hypothetical protein